MMNPKREIPILAYQFAPRRGFQFTWIATPMAEIVIDINERSMLIALRAWGDNPTKRRGFTRTEKLMLPDAPVVNRILDLWVYRSELQTAPRLARDPEHDPEDFAYDAWRHREEIEAGGLLVRRWPDSTDAEP